jgi:hypothetical protein
MKQSVYKNVFELDLLNLYPMEFKIDATTLSNGIVTNRLYKRVD